MDEMLHGYCSSIFIAIHSREEWDQGRCPPADKQVKKVRDIHTIEFYSTAKQLKFMDVNAKI